MKKYLKFIMVIALTLLFACFLFSCKSAETTYLSNETQIKIFTTQHSLTAETLEETVNEWLKKNKVEIISMQMVYQSTSDSHYPTYKIIIYYKGEAE